MASQWRSCWIRISHVSAAAVILHIIIISDSLCSETVRNEAGSNGGAVTLSSSPTPSTVGRARYPDYGRLPHLYNGRESFQKNANSKKHVKTEIDRTHYRKFYDRRVTMAAYPNPALLPPNFKELEKGENWNSVEQVTLGGPMDHLYEKVKILPATGGAKRISKRANVYFEDVDMTDTSHDDRVPDRPDDDQVASGNHTNNVDVQVRNKTSQGPKRSAKMAAGDARNGSALYKKARNLFHVGEPPLGTKLMEENGTADGWTVEKTPAASVDQGLDAAIVTAISLGAVVCVSLLGAVGLVLYRRRSMSPKPQTLSDKCSNPDSSAYIEESSDDSEEMYSLDNDSFLNSLEAMTIQNLWTDNVKHTKL